MTLLLPPARRLRLPARRAVVVGLALLAAGPAAQAQETTPSVAPALSAPATQPASTTAAPAQATGEARAAAPSSPAPPAAAPAAPTTDATSAPSSLGEPASPTPSSPPPGTAPSLGATEPQPVDAALPTNDDAQTLPHDLSPWGMFMAADWVVKGVMGGLAFASLVTWTILLAKGAEIALAKARARSGVRRLAAAESLTEAIGEGAGRRPPRGPVALLARAAEDERRRSAGLSADGLKERVAIALSRVEAGAGRGITRGTGLLATIGSTAPFVGLFGTVWGIMNSFIGISQANTTNLAVVAPGIAEALLATAIGLVAAIPAVVVYNVFARSISGYRAILSDGSALVMQHLSRQLDREAAATHPAQAPDRRFAQAAE